MATRTDTQSFREHLDVLRAAIVRLVAVAVVFGIGAFFFKEELFAVVIILVIVAAITPPSDMFTLSFVTLPMWILYEVSIWIVNRSIR